MPAPVGLAAAIGWVLSHVIASLIFKLITSLGIGFVTYVGVTALLGAAFDEIETAMAGLPVEVIKVFIALRIDDAISVLSAGVSIRLSFKTMGLTGDIRTLRFGAPAAPPP